MCATSPSVTDVVQTFSWLFGWHDHIDIIGITLPDSDPATVKQREVKLVSCVDDTQVFSSTEESIVETFKTANEFEKAPGAKINKTTSSQKGNDRSPENKQVFLNSSLVSKRFFNWSRAANSAVHG